MWAVILLGLLVGATASEEQNLWKPRTEYLYNISSVSLTAVNQLANQWTGIAVNISLAAKLRTPDTLQIQIKKVLKGGIHANLSGGFENPIPDELIYWAPSPLSDSPFELVYQDGKIIDMLVDCKLNNAQINQLKGIASLFQIDMEKEKGPVFSEYEETVTGICKTQYTRTPLPKYLLQNQNNLLQPKFIEFGKSVIDVTKETNFTKCRKSRIYNFGANHKPLGKDVADSLAHSSSSRAILVNTSDSYLLGSSWVTEKIAVSPFLYKQQKAMIASRMVALLTNFYPSRGPSEPEPKCSTGGLLYKFNEAGKSSRVSDEYEPSQDADDVSGSSEEGHSSRQRRAAGPSESKVPQYLPEPSLKSPPSHPFDALFVGYEGRSIQWEPSTNATKLVLRYSREIGEALYRPNDIPQKQTLSQFVLLTNLIQTFNASTLQWIADELYDDQSPRNPASQYAWETFVNALAQAGTGPALEAVIYIVNKNMVQGKPAADAVAYIPRAARAPNDDYLKAFFKFATKDVQGKYPVNNTAILAFSELVYLSQVSNSSVHRYPVSAYDDLLGDVKPEYINYLGEQLRQAVKKGYSPNIQLYIRAIGNLGHPAILRIFADYLEGAKKVTSFQRFMMVMALDKVIEAYPQRVQGVLLQLFQNTAEIHEIRCAASLLLMASNPSPATVQSLAQLTNSEQNSQVRAAVKTIIQSAVNLRLPKDAELARAAHSAVKMLTSEKLGYDKSLGDVRSYVVEKLGLAYKQWLRLIGSMDSSVHSTASFQLERYHGQLLKHRDELTSMVSSVQQLMRVVLNQTVDHKVELPSPKNLLGVTRNISEPLEGNILIDTLASKTFVAYDNNTIAALKAAIMSEIERIEAGQSYNKTILANAAAFGVGFPTILGMAASVRFNAPVAIAVRAKADLDASPNISLLSRRFLEKVKAVNVSSNISVLYSSQMNSKLNIIDSLAKKVYESSVVQNVQAYLPIKLNISYDFKNNVTTIEAEPANRERKYQVYHISRVPTTAVIPLVHLLGYREDRRLVHVRPKADWKQVYGPKSTGMAFELRYQSEAEFSDKKAAADRVEQHDYLSYGYFPLASEKLFYYNHSLYYAPEQSVAKNVTIKIRSLKLPYTEYVPPLKRRPVSDEEEDESYRAKRSPKFGRKRAAEQSEAEFYKKAVKEQSKLEVPFAQLAKLPIDDALPESIARIYERGTKYIFEANVTFEQPSGGKYRLSLMHSRNSVKSTAIATAHFYSLSAAKKPFQAYANALGYFPAFPVMNFEKALNANPNSNVSLLIVLQNRTQEEARIRAELQARRSEGFKQYLINSAVAKQCRAQMAEENNIQYACRNVTEQAGFLDDFELTGKYSNLSPEFINATYQVFSYLKQQLYPFVSERVNLSSPHPLTSGRFNATLKFSPRWHAFNASAHVPSIALNLTNVRGWKPEKFTPLHPSRHVSERLLTIFHQDSILSACALDKNNITTFDNLTIPFVLPNCWTTVLTYAPKPTWHNEFVYENVSIAIRPSAEGGRELKIVVGDNIIEQVTPSFIIVNSEKLDLHTGATTVVYAGDKILVEGARLPGVSSWIVLPDYGFHVYFDGMRVLVRANYTYKDAVRGLCGTYDGEIITDLTVPKNCIVRDAQAFVESYAVFNSECHDARLLKRAQTLEQCYPFEIIPGYYVKAEHIKPVPRNQLRGGDESWQSDESDSSDSSQQSEEVRPKLLGHKVRPVPAVRAIEHEGKYAFSLVKVPTCLPPLIPKKVALKPIPFHTVKKSPASKHWFNAVRKSSLSYDFSNKKHDVTIDIEIHISCKAY